MSNETRERSKAYPAMSLEDSVRAMNMILTQLGRQGPFDRDEIAGVLGYKSGNGGIGARKVGALTQFALLERGKGKGLYSPTPLSHQIVLSGSTREKNSALRDALEKPPLFKALLERYRQEGGIPTKIAYVLSRDYEITTKASERAAAVFQSSCRFAGVLDSSGKFMDEKAPDLNEGGTDSKTATQAPQERRSALESHPGSEQRFEFALTGGKLARLVVPVTLEKRDLELIKKQFHLQIEFLEFQVNREE